MNALDLLGAIQSGMSLRVAETLSRCQHPNGGFCGGPGQLAHAAATFASVNAIAIVGNEALRVVDRKKMYDWFMRVKNKDGSFCTHVDGETDIRYAILLIVITKRSEGHIVSSPVLQY